MWSVKLVEGRYLIECEGFRYPILDVPEHNEADAISLCLALEKARCIPNMAVRRSFAALKRELDRITVEAEEKADY